MSNVYLKTDLGLYRETGQCMSNTQFTYIRDEGKCSAFTVAELGELLLITEKLEWGAHTEWNYVYKKWQCFLFNQNCEEEWQIEADTEANARGKCLVYLLEQKLITLWFPPHPKQVRRKKPVVTQNGKMWTSASFTVYRKENFVHCVRKLKLLAGFFFGYRYKKEEIKYVQVDNDIELIYKGEAKFGENDDKKQSLIDKAEELKSKAQELLDEANKL